MPSAASLRNLIELSLESRFPAALTPQPRVRRETVSTGIPQVDAMLHGGLPLGAISEIAGPHSSGRTSLALSVVAGLTSQLRVCAWVDASDAFDAESAAAAGVSLRQLLWVRCRQSGTVSAAVAGTRNGSQPFHGAANSYHALDQALRAADLLLQAGGFSALVLDLASTPAEHGYRIPLATWFRFRQAADRTRCSLLVLAPRPFAQSSAALVMECSQAAPCTAGATVLSGFRYRVRTGRERYAPMPNTPQPGVQASALSLAVSRAHTIPPACSGAASARKCPQSTWPAGASWTGASVANFSIEESA